MHHSILTATKSVQLSKCTTCCTLYHCCWCGHFKPARLGALQKHINAHIRTALTFEDHCIIRCGLDCRSAAHYHCPWCENTLLRSDAMKKHLLNCKLQSGQLFSPPQSPSPAMHSGQSPSPAMHIGQSPSPAMHIGQSPSPAMHIGQSPSPAMHIGQSPSPAMHIGQSPSPAMHIGQSPSPAMHSGQSPSPAMHSGQSPSPVMHIGQSPSPVMHIGQSPSPAMHSGQSDHCYGMHSGQSPSPVMHSGQSPSPAMHIGQSPSPAMHIGQSASPAMHSGQSPIPVIHIGQSPSPAMHSGQSPSPVMHSGQSASPAMHSGQSPIPVIHIGQSPSPAMHSGQSPSPVMHIGQSPSPAMHIGQSPSPAMHIGQSPSPAMHIGQSPSPAMHIGQSPSPAMHSGQSSSPAMHSGQSVSLAMHSGQSSSPAMHSGQSSSPAMHSGQSVSLAMHSGQSPSPVMHSGQSVSPAMHSGQSPSPVMHSGQSVSPAMHIGQSTSSSGQLFSPPQSPSPAMHSGQSTSPVMHSSGQVLSSALPSSSGQAPSHGDPSTHSSAANSKIQCLHCSKLMYRKNLRLHIARAHSKTDKDITAVSHLAGVCVDAKNGISAVQRTGRGFSTPIHVQRKWWGEIQTTRCELDECLNYLDLCEHIRSLDYCDRIATEEPLDKSILDNMVAGQFFGEGKKATCIKRQQDALSGGVPFSVLVELGHSSRRIHLSIHEPEVTQHSKLGRIMVTYNKADNTWHCPCAKPRMSCAHQNIAKWHLFQFNGELFITTPPSSPTKQPEESDCDAYPRPKDLRRMTEYILSRKKIPFNLPDEVILKRPTEYPTYLYPAETKCLLCPDQPQLESPVEITRKAKIVTMGGIIANVSTFTRRCAVCQMFYRYQEWEHGLHNFNDHILLSLELCVYLRHNLQSHVSVSRVIDTLERLRKVSFPPRDTMLHAYCHFETLSDIDYTYSCVACGDHPPVVIMDLHNKGIFTMAVSEIKNPSDDYNGEQNITEFWNSVEMELICRGFVPSHAKNPLAVHPNSEHWAPWIGQQTRKSDVVPNTEYEKMSSVKSGVEAELQSITEERLVDELMKQKVGIVRKLCKACKVDDKGARIDLILRLRKGMKSRETYDKVFQQIWGASGGWSVILCPHGVAYSVKFNPRAESPRDLLFSWKHFPNVVMYDFARGLATHADQQRKSSSLQFHPPFQPTADTHEAAKKKKKLTVSLDPWLLNTNNSDPNAHPVPELQGSLNSRLAEQFFRSMKKNNYFLNNMAPSTHVFVMRNIVQHHNTETNAKLQTLSLVSSHSRTW